jgi:uncharacterized damage-inducible protein DinB
MGEQGTGAAAMVSSQSFVPGTSQELSMQTHAFIRSSIEAVNGMVDNAMQDLTDEIVNLHPGGTANTIAQILAHLVTGQDLLIHDKLLAGGGTTLHDSGWAAKTGIPLERPLIWQRRDAWRLNLPAFDDFRREVAASALRLLDSMDEAELDRQAAWVRGPERPVAMLWQAIFINHGLGHCGEISALKGLQGLKGLPI